MLSEPLSPLSVGYSVFRVSYVVVGLLGLVYLWRRPRPVLAVWLLASLNIGAWVAYVIPLGRLYALDVGLDRMLDVGTAACVAAGNSPWDHVQVGYASLEPFWAVIVAALALFRPELVVEVYGWLTPLSLIVVVLGVYWGLRASRGSAEAWERVLILFAVLGLSSTSLSGQTPIPPFWAGNFLLEPTHAMAWGIGVLVLGMRVGGSRWWSLGLALGLLGWVSLVSWGYVVTAIWAATFLTPRNDRDWRKLAVATLLSLAVCAPQILNLARDNTPFASSGAGLPLAWQSGDLGKVLSWPHWVTLDLGVLLLLGAGGVLVVRSRRSAWDRILLAVVASAWGLWVLHAVLAPIGVAPEPEELHYYLRLAMSLSAGVALAAAARFAEGKWALAPGRGHLLAIGVCLPLTFPAYWNPPTMDRHFERSLLPVGPKVLEYASWIRENTPPEAVFVAGPAASAWIPALTGRRVLLTGRRRPPSDYYARKGAEWLLMTGTDLARLHQAADTFGVTHVATDQELMREYGFEWFKRPDVYQTLYRSSAVKIMTLRPERAGPPRDPYDLRPLRRGADSN